MSPWPCGRRMSAPPGSSFPGRRGTGGRGGGICSGRCCPLPPPPTPASLSFFPSAFVRRRSEPALSLPPSPPARPGHFCGLETFSPRGRPGPQPSRASGGTDGLLAQDPGAGLLPAAAQALPSSLPPPSATGRGTSRRRSRPRPAWGAPSRALARRGRRCGLERRSLAPRVDAAPGLQCPSPAPQAAGALGEAWAQQAGGAGRWPQPEACLPPALSPEELLDCVGEPASRPRDLQVGEVSRLARSSSAPPPPQLANLSLR